MSLLRPLDPAFPIERQIAIEASPVVLVNVFTLDKADEQTLPQDLAGRRGLHEAPAGLHLHPASPRDRRKPDLSELRRSGNRPLTSGLRSRIRSSGRNSPATPPPPSLPRTCSRRSRCRTSSPSSRQTVGLGACGLGLPATCPGGLTVSLTLLALPTMSSSERESRKLPRCKEGSDRSILSVCRSAAQRCGCRPEENKTLACRVGARQAAWPEVARSQQAARLWHVSASGAADSR